MHKLSQFLLDDARSIGERVDWTPLDGKSLMITGASGLIGHYLLASLTHARESHDFTVIAVFHSEPEPYLQNILSKISATVYVGDLTDETLFSQLPQSDMIIHAAGYGQPGRFLENKSKTLKLNTFATFKLLDLLNPRGRFLFVSSSEIYSGSPNSPYKEANIGTTTPLHPRACYIEGKRAGETISLNYSREHVSTVVTRLSLAYGPGTKRHDQRVLNNFIEKGLGGKIELMDAGVALRTYVYVTDAVEMLWKMLLSGKELVYNLGGHSRSSIADLAKLIGDLMQVPVLVPKVSQTVSGAPDDVSLDMTLAENEFGKPDYVTIEEGLKRTIAWQRMIYS